MVTEITYISVYNNIPSEVYADLTPTSMRLERLFREDPRFEYNKSK